MANDLFNLIRCKTLALALAKLWKDYKEIGFFVSEGPEWFFEQWKQENPFGMDDTFSSDLLRLFVNKLMRRRSYSETED